jgi:uncharacterized protein YecE (DUF72 family)
MIYIGTSGWQYRHWRERFYPKGVASTRWLTYYAERFQAVEVNNTFYNLPKGETFEKWAEQTPDDFIFALKVSRFLTQFKRLKDPEEPVERFMQAASRLGNKIGPLLLQLPPNFKAEPERLRQTLKAFPKGVRVAVEFRHESWATDEVRRVLEEANAALCIADRGAKLVTPDWRTADWGYVRFHWGDDSPKPCYSDADLKASAKRLREIYREGDNVYVFFNNDPDGCALRDARVLSLHLKGLDRRTTRVPGEEEVRVG